MNRALTVVDRLGLFSVILVFWAVFVVFAQGFLSPITTFGLSRSIAITTVIGLAQMIVLSIGQMNLAVGAIGGMVGVATGWMMQVLGLPIWVAIVLGLLLGATVGWLNGLLITQTGINSFIVTLGMLEVARGGAYLVTDSRSVFVGAAIGTVGTPLPIVGLSPAFLFALLVVVSGQILLSRTVLGRYIVAIGTNREAVRLSGIDPRPVVLAVFAISGLLAGLGGVFHLAYLESADPNSGIGLELSAIAAVVIGGTSLMGGRGSAVSSFLGVLIIAVLQAGLAEVGATEPAKRIVTGAVIVAAVILDAYRRRRTERRERD